jgi:hypothetical protein
VDSSPSLASNGFARHVVHSSATLLAVMGWFATTRAILELLYFASGIAIAVFAFLGLRQIKLGLEQLKITKEIAKTNAKRESVKFASDQCRYFAETAMPLRMKMLEEFHRAGWTFLALTHPPDGPAFVIQNGEILSLRFNIKALDEQYPKTGGFVTDYLNSLESFAIPFAYGVADEEIGFTETARAFRAEMQMCMPAIFQIRKMNIARYESSMKLFVLWNNRLEAEAAAPAMKALGELKKAAEERIKPLNHNF